MEDRVVCPFCGGWMVSGNYGESYECDTCTGVLSFDGCYRQEN